MGSMLILIAAFCASAVGAMPAIDTFPFPIAARKPASLPSSFKWKSNGPLISPKNDGRNVAGIKDPTIVEVNGTYHVFASTAKAEGFSMVYLNFTAFAQASSAPFFYLDQSPIGTGYRAAPQVFYFAPQKFWYLVYQNGNAAYSTNPDISNPAGYWVDMWVICDKKLRHLFSSDDKGHLYCSQTRLANFPAGMSEPVIALQDLQNKYALWEAACVYAVKGGKGTQKYLLHVEVIGSDEQRWFRAWTLDRIDGEWTALADTYENPFARSNNVVFGEGVEPWTKSISHGEVVRSLTDQTLTVDISKPLRFMYQGMDSNGGGVQYNALPWRLALITEV
ncbi:glycoside hydrolase family 62 protein [Parathielavia hyrcaniae]|uniref:Alpha-L-arabinofuranosidase n=1 Tax=Parathielavia hyrcaniae TaxID=113614 RepID=A0AAN6SXN8_9PEZI|nr:glycoside hydrolase family 62 protein [Parathielavia hyrcaniae]